MVTISRIQHRRGLQQDLPQLASAELGWSIDQQRLYIGNGQLSEGSPRLGNTEILTEHSDILQLAEAYTYRNEDAGYTATTGGRSNRFTAAAFGNNVYVVVGTNGSIVTSYDGNSWSPVYGSTTNSLNDICYGNGLFVAVGASGTIIYSTDGSVWNNANSATMLTLTGVTYAAGNISTFVATSNTGDIIISPNANEWTVVPTPVSVSLNSVAYNNGSIIAVGNDGTVLTSGTGSSWLVQASPTTNNLKSVSWAHDQWLAAGDFGTVIVSLDGINWIYGFTDTFRAAATNGSIWVFVGDGGVVYRTSTADTTLSLSTSGTVENLYDVTYNASSNLFVAVGSSGTILTSGTGVTWVAKVSGTGENLNRVIYDVTTSLYVAVGDNGTIITSTDSNSWANVISGTVANLYGIASWGTTALIAVGANGTVLTSPNSAAWTLRTTSTDEVLEYVTIGNFGGGTYRAVAVGANGTVLSSDNAGNNWTPRTVATTEDLHAVGYFSWTYDTILKNKFVAVGNNGTTIFSNDGISWSSVADTPSQSHLFSVNYSAPNFWALGSVGYTTHYGNDITEGVNAMNNNPLAVNTSVSGFNGPILNATGYGNNRYIIAGQYNTVMTSADGQSFVSQNGRTFELSNLTTADIYDVMYAKEKFLAVGNNGLLLDSEDSVVWAGTSYVFGNSVTARSFQQKFDDCVSVKDFGAKGDGITDDTESINRAMYELYCRTTNVAARKKLLIPAGQYMISDGLNIPSNAMLVGEGMDNTVIVQTADPSYVSYVVTTADSKQQIGGQIGLNGAVAPSNIFVSDIGLKSNSMGDGAWVVNATNVTFNRVKMNGGVNSPADLGDYWTAVYFIGPSMAPTTDINFVDCIFEKYNVGVYQQEGEHSRNIRFDSCSFSEMYNAFRLCRTGGRVNTMTISNNDFNFVYSRAIDANYATNITSTFNSYRDVANAYQGAGAAAVEVIRFDSQSTGCSSISDQFDRTEEEALSSYSWVIGNSTSSAWFSGQGIVAGNWQQSGGEEFKFTPNKLKTATGFVMKFNDNSYNKKIQYLIVRNNHTRSGILTATYNASSNKYNLDDDSSETGDVGVIFHLSVTPSAQVSLDYTSTSGGADFTAILAESFLKTSW